MKDLLAYNGKLIHFENKTKPETEQNTNGSYAVVVDDQIYVLLGYHWQECFGIDFETGRPKVIVKSMHPNIGDLHNIRVVEMDHAILKTLCEIFRKGPINEDGYGTVKIGPINCDIHVLKQTKKE